MATPLQVLILEDNSSDAELMLQALRRANYDPIACRVDTEQDFRNNLQPATEIVLADFTVPGFDALHALEIMHECQFDIPVIIVSVAIGEDRAVEVMKHGATDYVVKDRLERLGHAVTQALAQQSLRRANRHAEQTLRENEELFRKSEEVRQREQDERKHTNEMTVTMNEALMLGSLRQHELVEATDAMNIQLKVEIDERKRTQTLLTAQKDVLELAANGGTQEDVLGLVVNSVQRNSGEESRASLFLLEPDGLHLRFAVSVGLSEVYTRAITQFEVNSYAPFCGTTAFTGQQLIVGDVMKDPRWEPFRQLAKEHEIRAVWSQPLRTVAGKVLGAMAVYYRTPREPKLGELDALKLLSQTAALVIERSRETEQRQQAEVKLRASEERFRTLFELGPVAVYSCDVSGAIREFNPRAAELWGRKPTLGETGERFCGSFMMLRPDGSVMPHEQCPIAEVLNGKTAEVRDHEVLIERSDGSRITALVNIRSLKNERGIVTGAINCFYDITERKRTEEALRDADRNKDVFLATLAHELRNPLAPIKNAAHILRILKSDDPTVNRAQRIIERQANHLAKLVDDLLDIARIQKGKFQLRKEHMDLGKAITRAVESCEHLTQLQGHKISVEIQSVPPLHIDADPTRIDQILVNLISNASKYTPSQGSIRISAAIEDGMAVVRIRDNGVGLEPKMLQSIFEVFTQVEQSLDRSQGGLGLGLKLVKGLVEMHGGSVEATSAGLNQGSEFILRFPAMTKLDSKLIAAVVIPEFQSSKRILVVDDNADIRETMEMMLTMSGHEVELAEDGPQAIQKVLQSRPDVAFIDIGLPLMNGYEVARKIRSHSGTAEIVLIALSGYGQAEDKQKALDAGFNAHLTKPVYPETIDKLLSELETLRGSQV